MGKTTLYHPISLQVIRGSAAFCGFKLAKITQLDSDQDRRFARYNAEIVGWPDGWIQQFIMLMQIDLQSCFASDIEVHWLRQSKQGVWMCHIVVDASQPDRDPALLPWEG